MKPVPEEMYHIFKMYKTKYDFMGYTFKKKTVLSFHHLIVPARYGGKITIDNGALLVRNTAHDYLHRIERVDPEIFKRITIEMFIENCKGNLDISNLKKIRDYLEYFEKEHCSDRIRKGKMLIKEEYISERIKLK